MPFPPQAPSHEAQEWAAHGRSVSKLGEHIDPGHFMMDLCHPFLPLPAVSHDKRTVII